MFETTKQKNSTSHESLRLSPIIAADLKTYK